jgi:hypothetical protein
LEIVAEKLSTSGWSWGCASPLIPMGDDSFENFPRNLGRDFVQYSCGRPEMTPQDEEPKKAK